MLPINDSSIAFVKSLLIIGDINDIIANTKYIIIRPSNIPYIIPPNPIPLVSSLVWLSCDSQILFLDFFLLL